MINDQDKMQETELTCNIQKCSHFKVLQYREIHYRAETCKGCKKPVAKCGILQFVPRNIVLIRTIELIEVLYARIFTFFCF